MDTREGERRLSKTLIWLVVICIWIPGTIVPLVLASVLDSDFIISLPLVFFFMGVFVHEILRRAVLWIIKGFAGEDKVTEDNIDN